MTNFGLVGLAGYIAPRHLKAIKETGSQLLAAMDPSDSVGVVDQFFPNVHFFTEIERFDRHLEKLRRLGDDRRVHYLSICSPNYLHDAHVRMALRVRAHAICEKPLVIKPWNLDALQELEVETGCRVYTVLQLRHHDALRALKEQLVAGSGNADHTVDLTYVTGRGRWYGVSWKGDPVRSGGVAMNIGIHFFDALLWLFGSCEASRIHIREPNRMAGTLRLERAKVRWFLSTDSEDLPGESKERGLPFYRSIRIDGQEFDFSTGFTELHTRVYEQVLAGAGHGIDVARSSIELVHQLQSLPLAEPKQGSLVPPA